MNNFQIKRNSNGHTLTVTQSMTMCDGSTGNFLISRQQCKTMADASRAKANAIMSFSTGTAAQVQA